ncbi:MAG: MFS transporter [Candidatus Komeilibacteria bacterium]|nr:MFS transporter [Candidatus Komeilibacteria bacterium]
MSLGLKFFKKGASRSLYLLNSFRLIERLSGNLLNLFLPVFFYIKFDLSLTTLIAFFILNYTLQALFIIPGAKAINKIGMRGCLLWAIPIGKVYLLALYFIDWNVLLMSLVALVLANIFRSLYWVPYNTLFARYTVDGTRGRQLGVLNTLFGLTDVVAPLLSSYLIITSGFEGLFISSILIGLLSLWPAYLLPKTREKYSWSYRESWWQIFSRKHGRFFWAYFGDGAQSAVGIVLWPIFIWLILEGRYEVVGIISALIMGVSLLLNLVTGRYVDKYGHKRLLQAGSLLYSLGWIAKMFVVTAFQVFAVSVYHNLAAIILRTPFEAGMYDEAAHWGHYTDEYTVIQQTAVAMGKVTALGIILFLALQLPLNLTFIIAVGGSLLMMLIRGVQKKYPAEAVVAMT